MTALDFQGTNRDDLDDVVRVLTNSQAQRNDSDFTAQFGMSSTKKCGIIGEGLKIQESMEEMKESRPECSNEDTYGVTDAFAGMNLEEKKKSGSDEDKSEASTPSQQ